MTDQVKVPHEWQPSTYGHGEMSCKHCLATNREIAVIGDLNHCPEAAKNAGTPDMMDEAKAIREALEWMGWIYRGGGPYPHAPKMRFDRLDLKLEVQMTAVRAQKGDPT